MKTFEAFLKWALSRTYGKFLVIFLTLIVFGLTLAMFPAQIVKAKMLPGKSADTFSVYLDLPTGSSHYQTTEVSQCVLGLLSQEREVTTLSSYIGMGSPLDYAGLVKGSGLKNGENVAEIVVNLTPKQSREESSEMMVHRLRPILQNRCASLVENSSIKLIEEPAGPPTLAAIVVELYGNDEKILTHLNKRVSDILSKTQGLVDVDTLEEEEFETFKLKVNTQRAQAMGVDLKNINDTLYMAYEGMVVEAQNRADYPWQVPLFIRLKNHEPNTNNPNALQNLLASLYVSNNIGTKVPIVELVSIEPSVYEGAIFSKNLQIVQTVVAQTDLVSQVYPLIEARNTIIGELEGEFEIKKEGLFNLKLIHKETKEPIRLVWDGEMKVTLDTFADLGSAFITALVIIFFLMVIYYKSFALSGIILMGSFLSIIGVILGHWVMDLGSSGTFFVTATSMIGFIALMGINSRNSLLIIDFAKSLMEEGMSKKDAIAHASATRAKPIFLTVITVVLASAMLTLDPVFGGLGVSLIFGSLASMVASLVFVPVLLDMGKVMD